MYLNVVTIHYAIKHDLLDLQLNNHMSTSFIGRQTTANFANLDTIFIQQIPAQRTEKWIRI